MYRPVAAYLDYRLPGRYVRIIIGTDVVLMNQNTRVVFDVISDAL
jgi:hypothetical protein